MACFEVLKSSSNTSARIGVLETEHGTINTPCFMPIGTYAAVKTLSSEEIHALDFSLILSNTYHLYLRPGIEILEKFKGLHNFMNWDKAILTDSGGYQIYSLSNLRKIDTNGVEFKSHLDGSKHYFTPEKIIDIQRSIGSDIVMVLDVCASSDASLTEHKEAVTITSQWAKRSIAYYQKIGPKYNHQQLITPIIQGGTNISLREESAEELLELNAPIYAIGGLAVGEPKEKMLHIVSHLDGIIPKEKPRYLMGVGTPLDLIECIAMGIDMFDCVIPTRNGRNGQIFTDNGPINIKNKQYRDDNSYIKHNNNKYKKYTNAYIHHLFRTNEILGCRIATELNLLFYNNLMINARETIKNGEFSSWVQSFITNYSQD